MNITIDTIRQFEAEAANYAEVSDFRRHVMSVIESTYEGVQLNTHGGLLTSREAEAIDRQLAALYREAGYSADNDYDLGSDIWARVRGEG